MRLQDRQGHLVIVFIVTAGALPALCLLNRDDLKWRSEAPKLDVFAFPSPAKNNLRYTTACNRWSFNSGT